MKTGSFITTLLMGAMLTFPSFAADLRIGLQDDPDMLDPVQSRTFVGRIVYTALCDKLVDISPTLDIVPQLATDWKWSEDGTELIMNLRQGVTFHDATPFNAAAVVANIERAKNMPESRRKSELKSVSKVEAVSEYQVKFTLTGPDVTLLGQLTDRAGMMVSPKAAAEMGADFSNKPVCSGPFKFVERVQQDRIVLEKFPEYWNAANIFIDKVTFLPIPDTTVRLANLQSGDLDMLERLAATDVAAVKSDSKLASAEVVGMGFMAVYPNIANGPRADNPFGKDKRLREAFSLAIDREALNQVVFEGSAIAGNQTFAPTSPWYNKDIPVPARDVEKAKALMKEAGHEKFEVEVQVANNPISLQMMQVVQSMVAEAGFDLKLKATEYATLLSEEEAGNYQLSRSDWSGRVDPDGNIHSFVTCEGGLNIMKYCKPEIDALLNDARKSPDNAVRKQKYDAAAKILNDDLPIIVLGHQSYIWAFNKKVADFVPYPDGMIRLQGLKVSN